MRRRRPGSGFTGPDWVNEALRPAWSLASQSNVGGTLNIHTSPGIPAGAHDSVSRTRGIPHGDSGVAWSVRTTSLGGVSLAGNGMVVCGHGEGDNSQLQHTAVAALKLRPDHCSKHTLCWACHNLGRRLWQASWSLLTPGRGAPTVLPVIMPLKAPAWAGLGNRQTYPRPS